MGDLIAVYIFGSVGRRQYDSRSDLDVLAVVKNGSGKVEEDRVLSCIPQKFADMKISVSWYGERRIKEMFENGELFAWHLYGETFPLLEREPFLPALGRPQPYTEGIVDVCSFQSVLRGIPAQMAENVYNAVYEMGLIYVCVRNVAMAASWSLCDAPDFTRYSPFRLTGVSECPISRDEYELTMACRMAGQRGYRPPVVVSDLVADVYNRLEPWIDDIRIALTEESREQQHKADTF